MEVSIEQIAKKVTTITLDDHERDMMLETLDNILEYDHFHEEQRDFLEKLLNELMNGNNDVDDDE